MWTCPRIEFYYVVDPNAGRSLVKEIAEEADREKLLVGFEDQLSDEELQSWDHAKPELLRGGSYPCESGLAQRKRRYERTLESFSMALDDVNGRLSSTGQLPLRMEELVAVRLYTGPMFIRYNAVMRGAGEHMSASSITRFQRLCQGNKYTTTLWSINSAIVKLGSLTLAQKVYRGVSGMRLPEQLIKRNEYNVIGGVDYAFMSTTLELGVARAYASNGSSGGIIIEIQQGLIDRGCDVSWLSQYPFEREAKTPAIEH